MSSKRFMVLSCAVAATLTTIGNGPISQNGSDGGALTATYETGDRGQRLFVRQGCYQCHGLAGQGSILAGPGLVPLRLDERAFRSYVRAPRGAMPPYSKHVLADADLALIEAYIRSLPVGQPYTRIRLLAAIAPPAPSPSSDRDGTAEALYQNNCSGCHGSAFEGGVGPSLKGIGSKKSADAIGQVIVEPPAPMPRLFPAALSRAQVAQLAAFLAKNR